MGFKNKISEKWNAMLQEEESEQEGQNTNLTPLQKTKKIIGIIVKVLYHSRKVVLAVPVVYYALRIAAYNSSHLPSIVGLFLQDNGAFAQQMTRSVAVMGPLVITGGCLAMMFLSRKALYAWAISLFSLLLPILLLVSNLYPA